MSVVRIVHSSVHTKHKPLRPPMLVLRPCEVEDVSTHSSSEHSVPAAVLGHGGEVERYVYVARTLGPGRRAIQQGDGDVPRDVWSWWQRPWSQRLRRHISSIHLGFGGQGRPASNGSHHAER